MLETRFLRIAGRRLFPIYKAKMRDGSHLYLSVAHEESVIIAEVFDLDLYQRHYKLQAGNTVVDVGGHIGSFTVKASKILGQTGRIFTFEPSRRNYDMLQKNIRLNGCSNVRAFSYGLGSEEEERELRIVENTGGFSLHERPGMTLLREEAVKIRTLDSIANELDLRKVDFLKVDVEGHELEVLKGGSKTLSTFRPKIAMETHSFGPPAGEVSSYLRNLGYQVTTEPYGKQVGLLYAE